MASQVAWFHQAKITHRYHEHAERMAIKGVWNACVAHPTLNYLDPHLDPPQLGIAPRDLRANRKPWLERLNMNLSDII